MKPLVIIGAGNLEVAKLVHAINRHEPTWEIVAYVDDAEMTWGRALDGIEVLGAIDEVRNGPLRDAWLVSSIGTPAARRQIACDRNLEGGRFATLIHPRVDAWGVTIGSGSLVQTGAVLSPGVELGRQVMVSFHVVIAHEVIVGDHVNLAPGAVVNGRSTIGEGAYVGSGATILPDTRIGDRATVGAGSVVTRAVGDDTTVFGVPARVIS